jgi:hypothetical protein
MKPEFAVHARSIADVIRAAAAVKGQEMPKRPLQWDWLDGDCPMTIFAALLGWNAARSLAEKSLWLCFLKCLVDPDSMCNSRCC